MATDMMLLMRGLAKLSQAVVETQSNALRSGTGKFIVIIIFALMKKEKENTEGAFPLAGVLGQS